MKYKEWFKKEMPETIGETDSTFDTANYAEFLEHKLNSAIEAAKAYKQLNSCFRTGKPPSNSLFKRLENANVFLLEKP